MAASWSPLVTLRLAQSRLRGRCVGCRAWAAAFAPPATAPGNSLCKAYTVQTSESISPAAATEAYSKALAVCHGPLDHYDFLIKARELKDDEHQRRVIRCLQKLHEDLKGYSIEAEGLFFKAFFKEQTSKGPVCLWRCWYRENNGDGHVLCLCGNGEEKTGSLSWFHARCSQKNTPP